MNHFSKSRLIKVLPQLVLVTAAAAFFPMVQAATQVEQAQSQLNSGDAQSALKTLDRYLASSPQDAEARFTRGLALVKLNKLPDALKVFSDLTRDYPQLPEPYNNLAVLYAQQGDYEKARDALEAALATHPAYATAHENLGDIYAALAGAAYNRALMLTPENSLVKQKIDLVNQMDTGLSSTAPASSPRLSPANPPVAASAPSPVFTPPPAYTPPEAPVAAAAPANAPEMSSESMAVAVRALLQQWTKSWSNKDVDGYLAQYSPEFVPEGRLSRSVWQQQRRERIMRPSKISVRIVNPEFAQIAPDRVRVTFTQDYKSDAFSDQVGKVLELKDTGSGWLIVREYIR